MELLTRSESSPDVPLPMGDGERARLNGLPTRQRRIVEIIDAYHEATSEACPGSYLGRRLHLHHSTIQGHLQALHRKGWLRGPNSPSLLIRRLR